MYYLHNLHIWFNKFIDKLNIFFIFIIHVICLYSSIYTLDLLLSLFFLPL